MFADFLKNVLHFADRQIWASEQVIYFVKNLFSNGFSVKQIVASVTIIANLLGFILFDVPIKPYGRELDLTGYTLVMEDEFNGDSLDEDVWFHRCVGERRAGFNSSSQVKVEDGNLVITCEYLENGEFGEGWYTGAVSLIEKYNKGYFEIKCKCNDGGDFWSAFWIQGRAPYDHDLSQGGIGPGGAEIDIFEAMSGDKKTRLMRDGVVQTIWVNGYDDDPENIESFRAGTFRGKNIYDEYNTYGLMWDENEYTFYINGVETRSTSFGNGTSTIPEDVIVSLEMPDEINHKPGFSTQFVVDYVRIYQITE